ncbi:MAG: hypothetical protein GY950_14940 [bacterium]|nr:hypothetical protein [bacterium]
MLKEWFITNKRDFAIENGHLPTIIRGSGFNLYCSEQHLTSFTLPGKSKKYLFLVDGYILPRREYDHLFTNLNQQELLIECFKKYGPDFVRYMKGNFIIAQVTPGQGFAIFTDRMGIKKVFYYHDKNSGDFMFSNKIAPIAHSVKTQPDAHNIAVEALTHHYIGGLTFLKDIFYSSPAARILFTPAGNLSFENYWDCTRLLNLDIIDMEPAELGNAFRDIVRRYIEFLKPQKTAVTLTGGLDSRTILAALLNLDIKPHAFTYGHPESPDVLTALRIAEACDLRYHNHYDPPSAGWFAGLAEEVIEKGDGIMHLHRAHRLAAIKNEILVNPGTDMVIGGYMGGESIRNFYYDGLIVPGFVKDWTQLQEDGDKKALIAETLGQKFIKPGAVDPEAVFSILKNQPFLEDSENKEFLMTFLLLAGTHHAQDPNLFGHFVKYPVPIYLDIDFLTLIFASKYNFLYKSRHDDAAYKKYLKRVKGAELYCRFIYQFSPLLAKIPFAKKGYYSAREYVKNAAPALMLKRMKRFMLNPPQGPANFALGRWMQDYVKWQLKHVSNHPVTTEIYDIDKAKHQLNINNPPPFEKDWRKYTNIIRTHLAVKKYMES